MDKLSYSLVENQLTPDPTDYMALTAVAKSYDYQAVIAEMLKRGTSLTQTDIMAVLNLFHQTIGDIIAEGNGLNLPLCNGSPSITGIFNGPGDSFDPTRHYVRYNLSAGTLVREAVVKIKTEKTDPTDKQPYIEQYHDVVSQTNNDMLTPGGIGQLEGSRLSFDITDSEQGISFVATDGTETKVTTIALNKPSKLIFMVPALAPGHYDLILKVIFRNTKNRREVSFRKSLTVVGETSGT